MQMHLFSIGEILTSLTAGWITCLRAETERWFRERAQRSGAQALHTERHGFILRAPGTPKHSARPDLEHHQV